MNYLPYVGFWFYGATSDAARAARYVSYGLLDSGRNGQWYAFIFDGEYPMTVFM